MTILSAIAGLCLLHTSVRAQEPNPPLPPEVTALIATIKSHSTAEWHRFDTLDAAAVYTAVRLEQCSQVYECSGFITIDPKGKYTVGPVRTDYAADNVGVDSALVPSDWKLIADIHSHPCLPHHAPQVFSPEDMMGALAQRRIAFMVDLCSGDVHEFIPGFSKVDDVPIGDVWLSGGTVIGHVAAFKYEPQANEGL